MFDFGKNSNSKNIVRPSTKLDGPIPGSDKIPKVNIDMTPNSIVNVLSGDPFKKSHEAKTQQRSNHVERVYRNF